jgi:2-octaprenyl-6-methoxyphenol hydroxylase
VISQMADRLTAQRLALVAEAAHVMPPIGAQGLNMSMRDIAALLDLARAAGDGLGDRRMLDAYGRARAADLRVRVAGIDMLNRVSMSKGAGLGGLRAAGLRVLHDVAPLRQGLMRLGLGAGRGGR